MCMYVASLAMLYSRLKTELRLVKIVPYSETRPHSKALNLAIILTFEPNHNKISEFCTSARSKVK